MSVLAVQLAKPQSFGDGTIDTGYRAVLAVTGVTAKLQTTVFYGNTLYMIWNNVGQLDSFQAFDFFLKQFINKSMIWGELSAPPVNPLIATSRIYLVPMPPPEPPIAEGAMTLLASGYDPMRGYWVEFAGNYFLTIPIYKDWPKVIRDTPNYKNGLLSENGG